LGTDSFRNAFDGNVRSNKKSAHLFAPTCLPWIDATLAALFIEGHGPFVSLG
jgi:hypothetical protein